MYVAKLIIPAYRVYTRSPKKPIPITWVSGWVQLRNSSGLASGMVNFEYPIRELKPLVHKHHSPYYIPIPLQVRKLSPMRRMPHQIARRISWYVHSIVQDDWWYQCNISVCFIKQLGGVRVDCTWRKSFLLIPLLHREPWPLSIGRERSWVTYRRKSHRNPTYNLRIFDHHESRGASIDSELAWSVRSIFEILLHCIVIPAYVIGIKM